MKTKLNRAFTLIELLVVVCIIATLAGILLAAIPRAIEQSRMTACMNNLRQLGVGFTLYAGDNNGDVPYNLPQLANGNITWVETIASYLSIKVPDDGRLIPPGQRPNPAFACPDSKNLVTGGNRSDYGKTGVINLAPSMNYGWKLIKITNPGSVIALADGQSVAGQCIRDIAPWQNPTCGIIGRHRSKANVLYFDWHVESIDPATIPTNQNALPWQSN